MTRRSFLQTLMGVGAAALVPVSILSWLKPKPKPLTAAQQREMIIARALDTPEGRAALAAAMVEPIKQSLMYQSLGRKLLMVNELPQGALARYERDCRRTR